MQNLMNNKNRLIAIPSVRMLLEYIDPLEATNLLRRDVNKGTAKINKLMYLPVLHVLRKKSVNIEVEIAANTDCMITAAKRYVSFCDPNILLSRSRKVGYSGSRHSCMIT
ncbi:MAG: hypothetical protein IKQ44_05185 [Lachnospiraceae bacterium]|nr:hypothetical protein [Lachnospiraceae bacterium]